MSGPQLYLGNPHQAALSQEQQQATQPENDPISDMGTDLMMDTILPGLGSAMTVSREMHGDGQRPDPLMDLMTGKPVSHIAKPETTSKPVEPESSGKLKPKGPTFDPLG
ncbi:MAG: hypothetical protein ACYDB0_00795 [Acidithiobacillus sp.]